MPPLSPTAANDCLAVFVPHLPPAHHDIHTTGIFKQWQTGFSRAANRSRHRTQVYRAHWLRTFYNAFCLIANVYTSSQISMLHILTREFVCSVFREYGMKCGLLSVSGADSRWLGCFVPVGIFDSSERLSLRTRISLNALDPTPLKCKGRYFPEITAGPFPSYTALSAWYGGWRHLTSILSRPYVMAMAGFSAYPKYISTAPCLPSHPWGHQYLERLRSTP